MQIKPISLKTTDADFETRLADLTAWESVSDISRQTRVAEIIEAVRSVGDEALLRLTRELDENFVESASDLVLEAPALEHAFRRVA